MKFRKLCICIIWQTSYQMCSQIRHDIPAENVPSRVDVPKEQTDGNKMNEPRVQLKRGRLVGSKDKNPRKKKLLSKAEMFRKNLILKDV